MGLRPVVWLAWVLGAAASGILLAHAAGYLLIVWVFYAYLG